MLYIGFDLGDGESCLTYCEDNKPPIRLPVGGEMCFISAVAEIDGNPVVGRLALSEKAQNTRVCFKRGFLQASRDSEQAITLFARGVLEDIRRSSIPRVSECIDDPEQVCFVVGCPAGWSPEDRRRYEQLLKAGGMRNLRLTSESRAAFESFAADQAFKVDRALFNQSVLVIDIGSSTLDFAYVLDGNEQQVEILGNTLLGGGMMDEMLLLNSVNMIPDPQTRQLVLDTLEKNPAAKSKLMVATRQMKENYFNNEDEYLIENRDYAKQALVVANRQVLRFNLHISPDIVENFVKSYPHPLLNNQTFENRLQSSLSLVKSKLREHGGDPALVILTGGPSRMRFLQEMCRDTFSKSRLVISEHPDSDISTGLCRLGHLDSCFGQFLADVSEYVKSTAVEQLVTAAMPALIETLSESMTETLYRDCIMPGVMSWKAGEIRTLNQFREEMEAQLGLHMQSEAMKQEMRVRTEAWVTNLMPAIQTHIDSLAEKHRVKNRVLKLTGVRVSASGDVAGPAAPVDFTCFEWIVLTVTTIVCGTLCGGAGVALLATGPVGVAIGVLIGIVAAAIGADAAEKLFMKANIPVLMRKLISLKQVNSPKEKEKVKASIRESFMKDENLASGLVTQIGQAIDQSIQLMVDNAESQL